MARVQLPQQFALLLKDGRSPHGGHRLLDVQESCRLRRLAGRLLGRLVLALCGDGLLGGLDRLPQQLGLIAQPGQARGQRVVLSPGLVELGGQPGRVAAQFLLPGTAGRHPRRDPPHPLDHLGALLRQPLGLGGQCRFTRRRPAQPIEIGLGLPHHPRDLVHPCLVHPGLDVTAHPALGRTRDRPSIAVRDLTT
ncbi:hypothetical protein GCM10009560_05470 [Nonomuraea longicatena]|uniref:Uncharacterized protein n=1 Tax=Nonomuraea longicatena TaxID=83682 RepID=A0ABP3Z4M7_9ACTN